MFHLKSKLTPITKDPEYPIMFIDPGILGTGWAVFPEPEEERFTKWTESGVVAPRNKTWTWKVWNIVGKIDSVIKDNLFIQTVVIEFPIVRSDAKSVASSRRGDLLKLTYLIGRMATVIQAVVPYEPILITPSEWKGQLPKPQVIKRIKRAFGDDIKIRNHEADAIGMGLAAQGGL